MNVREMPHIPQSLTLMVPQQSFLFTNIDCKTPLFCQSVPPTCLLKEWFGGNIEFINSSQPNCVNLTHKFQLSVLVSYLCLMTIRQRYRNKVLTANKQQMIDYTCSKKDICVNLSFPQIVPETVFSSKRRGAAAQSTLCCFVLSQLQISALFL